MACLGEGAPSPASREARPHSDQFVKMSVFQPLCVHTLLLFLRSDGLDLGQLKHEENLARLAGAYRWGAAGGR